MTGSIGFVALVTLLPFLPDLPNVFLLRNVSMRTAPCRNGVPGWQKTKSRDQTGEEEGRNFAGCLIFLRLGAAPSYRLAWYMG